MLRAAVPAARWLRNGHPAPHILGIHARQLQHGQDIHQKLGLTWHPFKLLVQSGTVLAFSRGKRIEKRSAKLVCVYFHHSVFDEQVGSLRFTPPDLTYLLRQRYPLIGVLEARLSADAGGVPVPAFFRRRLRACDWALPAT